MKTNLFRFLCSLSLAVICVQSFANHLLAERPNIVFAFADDWGRHASVYSTLENDEDASSKGMNAIIKTPNFDALAKEGVLFKNAFVNAPSCTPCRSSLLSGQHFWRTGRAAILQGAIWDFNIPSWPLLLEKNGYHIGYTHKVWGPGSPGNAPYGGSRTGYAKHGIVNRYSQDATAKIAKGQTHEDVKKHMRAIVRGNFNLFLEKRKDGQPFAYWFGPTNVHRKWIQGSGKKLWNVDPDALKGKMPPFLPDVHTVREDLADYLGETMAFDMMLGEVVAVLKEMGEYDNTVIAVSGDHGPAGFPHGKCNLYDFGSRVSLVVKGPKVNGNRVVDDMVSLPDLAPTFLEAGLTQVPDVMTAKSLWPTLAGEGSGLIDKSRTQVYIGRERHVGIARSGNLPYPQRAIRTHDFLFVTNFRPDRYPLGDPYLLDTDKEPTFEDLTQSTFVTHPDEDAGPTKAWIVTNRKDPKWKTYYEHAYGKRPREELYHLKTDPHQMKNLASDPEYAEVLKKLRGQLMTELETTNDPRLVDEGKFFETPPMTNAPKKKSKPKKKKK